MTGEHGRRVPMRGDPGARPSLCRIPEAALSGIGCCLYDFAGEAATLAAIRRNTAEFARIDAADEAALLHFRDRETPPGVVCCNCIEEAPGILGCPLHPARHGGRNPQTGEPLILAPRKVVKFKCPAVLKHKLNSNR